MAVTDKQVATLRAQLAGRLDEHQRLFRQLDWRGEGAAYTALIDAAFFEAADRRFGDGNATEDDVIAYVADVRSRTKKASEAIGPETAERLILKVLGQGSIQDLDARAAMTAKQYLLAALVIDEQLDDAGMDAFLAQARKLADQWLA